MVDSCATEHATTHTTAQYCSTRYSYNTPTKRKHTMFEPPSSSLLLLLFSHLLSDVFDRLGEAEMVGHICGKDTPDHGFAQVLPLSGVDRLKKVHLVVQHDRKGLVGREGGAAGRGRGGEREKGERGGEGFVQSQKECRFHTQIHQRINGSTSQRINTSNPPAHCIRA